MRKQIFIGACILTILLLINFASASYTKAELVTENTGEITKLNFETLSQSYGDQGGKNPNVVLRLYSDNPASDLSDNYIAAVVYSDSAHNNFIVLQNIVHAIGYDNDGSNYEPVGNYIDTDLDFSTSQANFPGFVYAVVSKNNGVIESSDEFIRINPEDSWLVGADGGEPCRAISNQWIIEDDCNIEADADQDYDSFDISMQQLSGGLNVQVDKAYWLSDLGYAVEINNNYDFVLEVVDLSTGDLLDSTIAKLDTDYLLDTKSTQNVAIYINGIKEGEFTMSQSGTVQSPKSSSSSGSKPGGFASELKFEFDDLEELIELTVYLKSAISEPSLDIGTEAYEGKVKNQYILTTNIAKKNIDSAYLSFKLTREWLRENKLVEDDIFLYQGGLKIVPEITKQDPEFVEFLVKLDELGDFLIGNTDKVEKQPATAPPTVIVEETPEQEEPIVEQPQVNRLGLYVLIVALIIIILFLLFGKKKRRRRRRRR